MTLIVLLSLLMAALASGEQSTDRAAFACAALVGLVSVLLLVVGDLERAVLLAAIVVFAIGAASRVKFHHSGIKLTVADFALAFAGTVPFLIKQYRHTAMAVGAAGLALGVAAVAVVFRLEGVALAFQTRLVVSLMAIGTCALAYRFSGGAEAFRASTKQRGGFFSTFMASLIDVRAWAPYPGLYLVDVADEALPLLPAVPARSAITPDIIIVQHESTFDPRLFGLPVDLDVASFLSPPGALSGQLNVDIFGGGSWQSEFSVLTGLSSASFGSDAYFMLKKGVGRFHHTLATSLTDLGYETLLVSSCRRSFLNYDAFYRSMGFGERLFTDDFPAPFDVEAFEATNADAVFAPAAVDAFIERVDRTSSPQLMYALTNFNHGPHDRRRMPQSQQNSGVSHAAASVGTPEYAEYYARLAETAAAWQTAKRRLAARFPDRPMLIVQYGDHQPVLTRRLAQRLPLSDDDRRHFRTFFSIEAVNFEMMRPALPPRGVLDIAFLGTVALQAAGLPLDRVGATRASLLEGCGEGYFASDSLQKRQFHRALVDLSLIDLAPVVRPRPEHAPSRRARRADAREA
jgi:Sulfatase